MIAIGTIGPNLGSLGEKHAITEGHDQLGIRSQHAPQFTGYSLRLLQILPTGHDQAGINAGVFQRQLLIAVEVLAPTLVQPRIGLQFSAV